MAVALRWLFAHILLLALQVLPLQVQASALHYKIKGLDKELKQNTLLYLEALPPVESAALEKIPPDIPPEIKEALQNSLMALGFYNPSITMSLDEKDPEQLNITITPGNPTLIRTLTIDLKGEANDDPVFQQLIKNLFIKEGGILNHGLYESLKTRLTDLTLLRGYFDAKMNKHSIHIYPDQQVADIHIELDSGNRYQFGFIRYGSMSEPTRSLIETMINIKPDQPYQANKLSQLNRDLSSTGYFSQIDIRPLQDRSKDYNIPIHVGVVPKTAHELETGIGFATDEGPRVSLTWDKPWLNDKGHSISNSFAISKINTELSSRYKIPAGNPLMDYYTLDVGYQKKIQDDTNSELISTAVHRWFKRPDHWDQDLFFRIEYEDFTQGQQIGNSLLLIPGIALNRRKIKGRDGLDPKAGYTSHVKLEVSHQFWGSDTNFIKLWTHTKGLITFKEKHRFIARAEQGAIWVDDIYNLPPSIRFFTGGDQSVRGYNFESISPKDGNDKLIGARYVSAFSGEYNYEFIEKWRLAAFIDSGTATQNYQDKWKIGTGVGLRWVTPLGPLKLDLAFAISEDNTPWRIHFTMGPDL